MIGICCLLSLSTPFDYNSLSGEDDCSYEIRIAYQIPINIQFNGDDEIEALSRTFEDSLIYSNIEMFKSIDSSDNGSLIKIVKDALNEGVSFEAFQEKIFKALDNSARKAEFVLDLIYSVDPEDLNIPNYIHEGLDWLEEKLTSEA